jgi:hypothetical protein
MRRHAQIGKLPENHPLLTPVVEEVKQSKKKKKAKKAQSDSKTQG